MLQESKKENQFELQANQSLVVTFENVKKVVDEILDFYINGIFLVVDENGLIFRANNQYSDVLGLTIEKVIGTNFSKFFSKSDWSFFKGQLATYKDSDSFSDTIVLDGERSPLRKYSFRFKRIEGLTKGLRELFVVIGQDITELTSALNENFLLSEKSSSLEKTNDVLVSMLDSLNQGFLLIDNTGKCYLRASKACTEIFGRDPSGMQINEVLNLSEKESAVFNDWLRLMFSSPKMAVNLIELAPKKLNNSFAKEVILEFKNIFNTDKRLKYILLVATDKTNEMKALKQLRESEMYVEMILNVVRQKEDFITGVASIQSLIEQVVVLSNASDVSQEIMEKIKFNTHTIKGTSAYLSMAQLHDLCHEFESRLSDADYSALGNNWKDEYIIPIQNSFNSNISEAQKILGLQGENFESRRDFSETELFEFLEEMKVSLGNNEVVKKFYFQFYCRSFIEIFRFFENETKFLAKKMGKSLLPFVYKSSDLRIDYVMYKPFFDKLGHLFRNMLDHGIETEDVRKQRNKNVSGTIEISVQRKSVNNRSFLNFTFSDDGSGINKKKLREKLCLLNPTNENISDTELIQKIFDSGITTSDAITKTSGRGVGMASLKEAINQLGGTITVFSQDEIGTRFVIDIPDVGFDTYINGR